MKEYIVIGDYENHKGCLIYTCGVNRERAQRAFETAKLLPEYENYTNIRIEEIESKGAWWNQNCD